MKIERGLRQGATLLPKLFITIEYAFKYVSGRTDASTSNGRLRFSDDIVLICDNLEKVGIVLSKN